MFKGRPARYPQDGPWLLQSILDMAYESEAVRLHPEIVERGIAHIFAHPEKGTYYVVADDTDAPIGVTLVTSEWSDWNNADYWWFQSVYVAPQSRGQGALSTLVQFVKDAAQSQQVSELRLYVESNNARARQAYEKLGFQGDHYQMMQCQV